MDHEPFFKRGPSPFARLAFFGLLSIMLMAVDARFNQLSLLCQGVGLALYPLQQVANSPLVLSRRAGEFFVTQNQLASEHARLKQQHLATSFQVQRNQSLQAENAYLRRFLASRQKFGDSALAVEIMSDGRDPFSRRIIVDKGSSSHIRQGQAPVFSRCLAAQCAEVLAAVGGGDVLEFGAGSGAMAAAMLAELEVLGRLPGRYRILEVSADLRERQRATIEAAVPHLLERVEWLDRWPARFTGVVVANEGLDAMPVERFTWRDGGVEAP